MESFLLPALKQMCLMLPYKKKKEKKKKKKKRNKKFIMNV